MNRREFLMRTGAGITIIGCGSPTLVHVNAHFTARPGVPGLSGGKGLIRMGLDATRDATLYVPAAYDPAKPMPLFIGLHGSGGSSLTAFVDFYDRAEKHNFIFLAPSSRDYTWNLIANQVGPDIAFIDQALTYIFARYRINASKICLGGFSDGATYALSVGLSNGDLFTNLAAYSPGFLAESDTLVGKPPIWLSHGTADSVLPFRGTENIIVPQLKQQGYNVTFIPFDGNHGIPSNVAENSLNWFLG